MKVPPCKDCDRRSRACHDACKEYKDWAAEVRKEHDTEKKDGAWWAYRNAMFKKEQK